MRHVEFTNSLQFATQPQLICSFAFPDDERNPAQSSHCAQRATIAHYIGCKLAFPEFPVCSRCGRITAFGMPVPEAPMDVDRSSILGQNNVRSTGQIAAVQAESIATSM